MYVKFFLFVSVTKKRVPRSRRVQPLAPVRAAKTPRAQPDDGIRRGPTRLCFPATAAKSNSRCPSPWPNTGVENAARPCDSTTTSMSGSMTRAMITGREVRGWGRAGSFASIAADTCARRTLTGMRTSTPTTWTTATRQSTRRPLPTFPRSALSSVQSATGIWTFLVN